MSNHLYILNAQGEPQREPDLNKWAEWIETAHRHVALDHIGDSKISTVFLGLDHGWKPGPPVLWETMVFGGPHDQETWRCAGCREQALAQHARMLALVQAKSSDAGTPP